MTAGAMPRLPRAACRTPEGAQLFLNVTSNTVPACRRVCMDCPERRDCFLWGLLHEARWGVWGGLTADELTAVRAEYGVRLEELRAGVFLDPISIYSQTRSSS